MDNWSFSLSKLLILLTLVIVEVALCPPDNSIGSFPNFWFIIDDMGLLFFRGGACNGTLERERERKKKYNRIRFIFRIEKRILFSLLFFYLWRDTALSTSYLGIIFFLRTKRVKFDLDLEKKVWKNFFEEESDGFKAQNFASEHFINVAKCIVNCTMEKRCARRNCAEICLRVKVRLMVEYRLAIDDWETRSIVFVLR